MGLHATVAALLRHIVSELPKAWQRRLAGVKAERIVRGQSGARVWRLQMSPEHYLKVADGAAAAALADEVVRTRWLAARGIRVGRVAAAHARADRTIALTEAVPGIAADQIGWPADKLLTAIGAALARVHALPVRQCPFDEGISVRLARAAAAIAQGDIDPAQFDARNRRTSPRTLWKRLAEKPPRERLVVTHGDASLSNMLIGADGTVGFIDCGRAGRADRYLDLAVLADEVRTYFGCDAVRALVRNCGLRRWNERKAAYYSDLYELF